jgi:hypothetical protein
MAVVPLFGRHRIKFPPEQYRYQFNTETLSRLENSLYLAFYYPNLNQKKILQEQKKMILNNYDLDGSMK